MKKKALIFIGTALTAAAVTAYRLDKKSGACSLPKKFTITAHTGCEGTDNNSPESIRAGINVGADITEIDLHFLPDGTPVLSHDTPVGDEPTLESAFRILSESDVKMNVDLKSTANLKEVVLLAEKTGVTEKIFFTGVTESFVEAVRKDTHEISYYLNVSVDKNKNTDKAYLDFLVKKVKDSGAVGINMHFNGASKKLVEAFHGEGLLVSLWTANRKCEMKKCLKLSPDNITTRKPGVLLRMMGKE